MLNFNKIQETDIDNIKEYYTRNKNYIERYDEIPDFNDSFFKGLFNEIEKEKCFCYCLKDTDKIIGLYYLEEINRVHYNSALLSYNIDQEYSNKGITTKLLKEHIPTFLKDTRTEKLKCIIEKDNQPSIQVLKKLNFSFFGPIPNFFKINNKMNECYLAYSNSN